MTILTIENGAGREPAHARIDRQIDGENLQQEPVENNHESAASLSGTQALLSIQIEARRGDVYLFRKSKRASRGAARII